MRTLVTAVSKRPEQRLARSSAPRTSPGTRSAAAEVSAAWRELKQDNRYVDPLSPAVVLSAAR